MAWVYGIQSGLFIKIGVTGNIPARLKQMNLYNPHPCKVVARRQLENAYEVEKRMHTVLAPYAIGREWFLIDAKLVRAALTVVIKELQEERIAWQIECARKQAEREGRAPARGLEVASREHELRKIKRANKIKMLERLNEQ